MRKVVTLKEAKNVRYYESFDLTKNWKKILMVTLSSYHFTQLSSVYSKTNC